MPIPQGIIRPVAVLVLALSVALPAAAQGSAAARTAYQSLLARERALAANGKAASPAQVRRLVNEYVRFAGRYARTGYADNALWQAARLAGMLGDRLRREADRATGRKLLRNLISGYPSSSLVAEARAALRDLSAPLKPLPAPAAPAAPAPSPEPTATAPAAASAATPVPTTAPTTAPATLREIRRTVMPAVVRVTLELTREITYRDERLDAPSRIYFDLAGTSPDAALADATLTFPDDLVREIRVGQRAPDVTRVVLDFEGAERYTLFTLYGPYRLVIDVHRRPGDTTTSPTTAPATSAREIGRDPSVADAVRAVAPAPTPPPVAAAAPAQPQAIPTASADPVTMPTPPPPAAPTAAEANASGSFSIARQLGLNVSRIVIDPGHGGRDPGALGTRVSEAEIVLDVALRLEKLLRKHPVFDVVMTRRTDVFVPLEERTAIANRTSADLFLSIHANASRNVGARGVETYFLNFASNAEAAAVAARENASSGRAMHQLGDIVRAIALNNKLDESREFASIIQTSLARQLRGEDADVRDLGVKQAPFVVLIGASMPSVLAEISFVTNPKDAQLLRSAAHRQKIAESLYEAVVKYQRTLKASETVALQ